jgi:hypothetical protein
LGLAQSAASKRSARNDGEERVRAAADDAGDLRVGARRLDEVGARAVHGDRAVGGGERCDRLEQDLREGGARGDREDGRAQSGDPAVRRNACKRQPLPVAPARRAPAPAASVPAGSLAFATTDSMHATVAAESLRIVTPPPQTPSAVVAKTSSRRAVAAPGHGADDRAVAVELPVVADGRPLAGARSPSRSRAP